LNDTQTILSTDEGGGFIANSNQNQLNIETELILVNEI